MPSPLAFDERRPGPTPLRLNRWDVHYRTRRAGSSYALRERLDDIVHELSETRTIADPARAELLKTRKAVIAAWNAVAAKLESQGEID